MKAKQRAVAALAACALALIALLGWLLYRPQAETPVAAEATVYEVVAVSPADIAAVKVENAQDSYAVLNGADGVEMISQTAGAYDPAQLRALLYAAGHITGSRKVTDESAFSGYGLDEPQATVTLFLADQRQMRFQVLANNPLENSVYFWDETARAVYLIPGEVAALFLRTSQDFISHTVFSLYSRDDYSQIDQIIVKYNGNGRDYQLEQTDQGFYLTSPVRLRLSQASVYANVLNPMLQLYADQVIATQADLSQYGLDQPELTLTLTLKSGETQRAVFLRTKDNQCLMADPEGAVVYQLDDAPLLLLMQDYTALLAGGIVAYTGGDLQDVTLTQGDHSFFLTCEGDGTEFAVSKGATELSQAFGTQLLEALNGLAPVGELNAAVTADPVCQFTASLRSGTQETVALMPLGSDLYAVSVNGTAAFATDAEALQRLQAIFDTLIAQE
ncbi:MAG TPA: DUF4340 domain-containing protein [Candidatus Limiplasma sp.]|nr:DUF4340 domain-containing protein [Candidatus Limiplasma sp.]HPS80448.1 DUF4340 domain-containing protein [Candidatus Limiplasma sp.]